MRRFLGNYISVLNLVGYVSSLRLSMVMRKIKLTRVPLRVGAVELRGV